MRLTLWLVVLVASGSALVSSGAEPAEWRQWRGPNRDGQLTGVTWPNKIQGDSLKQIWQIKDLAPSYSGPIVASDRVFTTETVDKKTEVVTAFNRSTGKEIWKVKWDGTISVPFFAAKNGSWIRSTPAYDGKTLFVAGIRDVLVALDGETGKERWRVDFVKEFAALPPDFGFV